jgi:hypothetical protein
MKEITNPTWKWETSSQCFRKAGVEMQNMTPTDRLFFFSFFYTFWTSSTNVRLKVDPGSNCSVGNSAAVRTVWGWCDTFFSRLHDAFCFHQIPGMIILVSKLNISIINLSTVYWISGILKDAGNKRCILSLKLTVLWGEGYPKELMNRWGMLLGQSPPCLAVEKGTLEFICSQAMISLLFFSTQQHIPWIDIGRRKGLFSLEPILAYVKLLFIVWL